MRGYSTLCTIRLYSAKLYFSIELSTFISDMTLRLVDKGNQWKQIYSKIDLEVYVCVYVNIRESFVCIKVLSVEIILLTLIEIV